MTREKIIISLFRFADGITTKEISAYASSTAFFFFIAIIPLMILLSKLMPLTGITDDQLINTITGFTPDFADLMVIIIVKQAYVSAVGVVSVSAVVLFYATARGMLALLRGLNSVYEVRNKNNCFIMMRRAFIYTLIMVTDLVLLLVVIVFGESIMDILIERFNVIDREPLIYSLRYLLMFIIGTVSFMLVYAYLPDERQPFRKQLPGAAFATLAWMVFSFFFSLFIGSSIYATYYGSLAAIAVFMMWMYGGFYILLTGANINHSLTAAGAVTAPKHPEKPPLSLLKALIFGKIIF